MTSGELKIIAAILEQPVIEKILTHLGLQADCGRRSAPARGPAPQEGLAPASASAARRAGHRPRHQPVGRRCKRPEHKSTTVDQAAWQHELRGSAASGVLGSGKSGSNIRVHPQEALVKNASWARRRRSADRSQPQKSPSSGTSCGIGAVRGEKKGV